MEIFVDDDTKLTLHGLQQYYCKVLTLTYPIRHPIEVGFDRHVY